MTVARYPLLVREDQAGRYTHRIAVDDEGRPARPRAAMAALGPPSTALGHDVPYAVGRGPTSAWAVHRWIAWIAGVPPDTSGLIVAIADWLGVTRQAWDRALSRMSDGTPRQGASAEAVAERLGLALVHVPGHGDRSWMAVRVSALPEATRFWLAHPLPVGLSVDSADADDGAVSASKVPLAPALPPWEESLRAMVAGGGLSVAEMSTAMGCSVTTTWRRLRSLGLAPRLPRGREVPCVG